MKASIKSGITLTGLLLVGVLTISAGQNPVGPPPLPPAQPPRPQQPAPAQAPVGFDHQTNGFVSQTMMDSLLSRFQKVETEADGLGPLYNATSCGDCHATPVIGGSSQITVLRAGIFDGTTFQNPPGGRSLINDRAVDASIQERVDDTFNVRALRVSLTTLGDGFVEAISDDTLLAIANRQPPNMRGQAIMVPVLEANGALRVGRFGAKDQHASLESFAADAYLNEIGITSPLLPTENTALGRSVDAFDKVADPEDDGSDVRAFAQFMRATKAPPRDEILAATADSRAGERLFGQIGCATCHVRQIVTAPAGTRINGGAFVVPAELGNKVIQPWGDFLLHDVGTGDGIVQNGDASTMNKVRTSALWGLRTRTRLMHDGLSLTPGDAILRHKNEAAGSVARYIGLSADERNQLLTFLNSL